MDAEQQEEKQVSRVFRPRPVEGEERFGRRVVRVFADSRGRWRVIYVLAEGAGLPKTIDLASWQRWLCLQERAA